jgi:hypothetical protein
MTKALRRLAFVGLVLAFALPGSAWARVVRIETTTPLSDHSDQAIDRALEDALDRCVRGATAMGLSWIRLDRTLVLTDKVIVRMVATDKESEDDDVRVFDSTARSPSF